jgi:hypothetical protein
MSSRHALKALEPMTDDDRDIELITERFERRLGEESSKLRVEMATEFGKVRADMATEFGKVRAEMATEFGNVRTEMATEFGKVRAEHAAEIGKLRADMNEGFGSLRSEMIHRNSELLKWGLGFGAAQTAAVAALLAFFR